MQSILVEKVFFSFRLIPVSLMAVTNVYKWMWLRIQRVLVIEKMIHRHLLLFQKERNRMVYWWSEVSLINWSRFPLGYCFARMSHFTSISSCLLIKKKEDLSMKFLRTWFIYSMDIRYSWYKPWKHGRSRKISFVFLSLSDPGVHVHQCSSQNWWYALNMYGRDKLC